MAALFAAVPFKDVFGQSFKERDGNPTETPPVQNDPLGNYSKASFVSYLNSIFQIQSALGVVEVTLAKVDDMPSPKGGECFSLLFRGGSKALKQDTYLLVHPSLGNFQLFLVPGGPDQNGAREYLATINRLSPADLANMTAPSRTTAAAQPNNSAGAGNSTSTTTSSSSTASQTTQVTAPTVTQTNIPPTITTVSHKSSASRHRKRKPARKRMDSKATVIN
jgi:hypothetical protein